MARGDTTAQAGEKAALGFANTAAGNAGQLYGTLAPTLTAESMAPPGMAPADLAAINTAGQQSAGGSQAAAVGQGALKSARTRNLGGADAAIAESTRTAGENLSKGALGTQLANTRLKESQRQAGLSGLGKLYGENLGAETGNINALSGASQANTAAANASWDWAKYLLDPAMSAASRSYAAMQQGGGGGGGG